MKKFSIILGIVLVVILSFMWAVDRYITNNLHHSSANMYRCWNELIYGEVDYDLIINGNSRAWTMYSPAILDSALHTNSYNIGLDGRGIDTQSLRFYEYCLHHTPPKYVIQNVEAFTLEPTDGYEREQFLPYFNERMVWNFVWKYEDMHVLERYVPLIRYSGYRDVIYEGFNMHNQMTKETVYKGYNGHDVEWDGTGLRNLKKCEFAHDSLQVRIMDEYFAFCKNKNIRVILVFAPMYVGAIEKMTKEDYDLMMEIYYGFAYKYDMPFINFLDNELCQDTVYFYNASHMNKLGSELFSRQLVDSIKKIDMYNWKSK